MNTQGAWQEEYSWRLAKLYGYSVPIAIYKYGNIKISPFVPWRRRHYVQRLVSSLRRYGDETLEYGYGERPDVIAHSLGTWLLYKAMDADPELKVGRVILTGSIIPPDFRWGGLIASGRVEAVLCHCARKDFVVRLAQFGISESGPSGYRGFDETGVVAHKLEATFGHSDFFSPGHLATVMETVWGPFLSSPLGDAPIFQDDAVENGSMPWKPSRWRFVTRPLKSALLIGVVLLCALLVISAFRGFGDTLRWGRSILAWPFSWFS
jgi:hypothetical protein